MKDLVSLGRTSLCQYYELVDLNVNISEEDGTGCGRKVCKEGCKGGVEGLRWEAGIYVISDSRWRVINCIQ